MRISLVPLIEQSLISIAESCKYKGFLILQNFNRHLEGSFSPATMFTGDVGQRCFCFTFGASEAKRKCSMMDPMPFALDVLYRAKNNQTFVALNENLLKFEMYEVPEGSVLDIPRS